MSTTPSFSRWRPHPWHGLSAGPSPPDVVHAYVEITPFDSVKYEIDKRTGYLRVDRPQRMTAVPPTLYGFVPRTWCGPRVASLTPGAQHGDGDPLDVCVISERPIDRAEVIVEARVVGGLGMLDGGEADDKIVAVLVQDAVWSEARELDDLPEVLVQRLRHYFSTYKLVPGLESPVAALSLYGRTRAHEVVQAARLDYHEAFGDGPQ